MMPWTWPACDPAVADTHAVLPYDTGVPSTAADVVTETVLDSTETPSSPNADSGTAVDSADSDIGPTTPTASGPPLVVYATRHAEKWDTGADPGLTPEGQARAEALAVVLHDVPLAAVYATEWQRTQLTALPTALDHTLPVSIDLDPETELAPYLLAVDPPPTVLSVGHSYTVSDFLAGLGVREPPVVIDYGVLWTVTVWPDGTTEVLETRYGDR